MQLVQDRIFAQGKIITALIQEVTQFRIGGIRRGTAMAGDRKRAACIGIAGGNFQPLIAQPAAQEPGHKAVPCTEDIIDLNLAHR